MTENIMDEQMLFSYTIPGKPVPSKLKCNKIGRIFNARKAYITGYRFHLKSLYQQKPFRGEVRVSYFFGFPIPKSWPKQKKEEAEQGGMPYPFRPDYDNLEKTYNDIIKGIVIADDDQIIKASAKKEYTTEPRTDITIYYAQEKL
jgi:Holliday junction resolvase RusA-like endonuclease